MATPSAMSGVSPVTNEWARWGSGRKTWVAAKAVPGTATAAVTTMAATSFVRFFMVLLELAGRAPRRRPDAAARRGSHRVAGDASQGAFPEDDRRGSLWEHLGRRRRHLPCTGVDLGEHP